MPFTLLYTPEANEQIDEIEKYLPNKAKKIQKTLGLLEIQVGGKTFSDNASNQED